MREGEGHNLAWIGWARKTLVLGTEYRLGIQPKTHSEIDTYRNISALGTDLLSLVTPRLLRSHATRPTTTKPLKEISLSWATPGIGFAWGHDQLPPAHTPYLLAVRADFPGPVPSPPLPLPVLLGVKQGGHQFLESPSQT